MSKTIFGLSEHSIRELYDRGLSNQAIAAVFGCSPEGIRKRMKRYGIERRPVGSYKGPKSPEHTEKLRQHMATLNEHQKGKDHPTWKGESWLDDYGYAIIRVDGKSVKEHRYVAEQFMGRKLHRREHVHHKDGIKTNNDPHNLIVLTDIEHGRLHMTPDKKQQLLDGMRLSRLASSQNALKQ